FQDTEPGKLIAARISAKELYYHRHPVLLKNTEWNTLFNTRYFDVMIAPVLNEKKKWIGSVVTFSDITSSKQLIEELQYKEAALERLSENLQATKIELEATYQEIDFLMQDIGYEN
ncbi:MAG TPA: hypothetical protein V6C65_15635, partial [Allocoleopsis sp.]